MQNYERIAEVVLRWFGHVERMEKDRIAKRVNVCSIDRLWKRWNDTVKDWLKKSLPVRQAGRVVHDRSEWQWFVRWNVGDIARVMNY